MLKNLIGKIGKSARGTLLVKNRYGFRNQVPRFDSSKDYYEDLGVSKSSSDDQIKRQYYTLAKKYHPDSNPGYEAKFKEINEAYGVLSDSNLRKQYDASRLVTGFSRRMGNKMGEGNFNYEQYRTMFYNMSPEEQEQMREQGIRRAKRIIIFGLAMLVILPFLTRRNHRYYIVDNGELLPVEFQGGMRGGMMPPPGMYGPYGSAPHPNQMPYSGQGNPYGNNAYQGYQQPIYPQQPLPPQGYRPSYNSPYSQVARNVSPQPPHYQRGPSSYPGNVGQPGPQ